MKTSGQMRLQLMEKAAEDDAFRARLLDDPQGAIKEELGVDLPEGLKINVVEDSPDTTNIVLPPKATLNAAEMETVSGAVSWLRRDTGLNADMDDW